MASNPFTSIEEKLDKIETILLQHFENKKEEITPKPSEQLPIIGGIELATLITGFKKSTIHKLTSEGKIPYQKPGGKLRFLTSDLLAWVKRNSIND
jgi:excisionase family DNA binding protein